MTDPTVLQPTPPNNEFSRMINVAKAMSKNMAVDFQATPEECAALAERFGLASVSSFQVSLAVGPGHTHKGGFYVTGSLMASVVQRCVATSKDVPETVNDSFELHILDKKHNNEQTLIDLGDDDVEFSAFDEVDLGEVAAQYLSLALNPYPRFEP